MRRVGETCYSLTGLITRASVKTSTALAPPRNNVLVQADTVAPVVNTSSTSNTRQSDNCVARPDRMANAPATFRWRALDPKPPCEGVARVRTRRSGAAATEVI
jgi:hypothetical protein